MSDLPGKLAIEGSPQPLFVLIDPSDGTMFCVPVSCEYDVPPSCEHEEVVLFLSADAAARAAEHELEVSGMELIVVCVAVTPEDQ